MTQRINLVTNPSFKYDPDLNRAGYNLNGWEVTPPAGTGAISASTLVTTASDDPAAAQVTTYTITGTFAAGDVIRLSVDGAGDADYVEHVAVAGSLTPTAIAAALVALDSGSTALADVVLSSDLGVLTLTGAATGASNSFTSTLTVEPGNDLGHSTDYAYVGSHSLKIIKSSAAQSGVITAAPGVKVFPGGTYAISASVLIPETVEDATLEVTAIWYASSDATGSPLDVDENSTGHVIYAGSGWTRIGDIFSAPAEANSLKIGIVQPLAGSQGSYFYADAFLVEEATQINQYFENKDQNQENAIVRQALRKMPEPIVTGMQLKADISLNGLIMNTIDENNVVWVCTDIEGWWGQPDPEIQDISRGLGDGSYDVRGRYTARIMTFNGTFLPPTADLAEVSRNRLITATDLVRKTGWLVVDENPPKAALVRLSGKPNIRSVNARGRTEFSIGLKAVDPIKYEWIVDGDLGDRKETVSTNDSAVVNNIGNTPVTALFELSGFINAGSVLRNDTTNEEIKLSVDIKGPDSTIATITKYERISNEAVLTLNTTYVILAGDLINVVDLASGFNGTDLLVTSVLIDSEGFTVIRYDNVGDAVTTTDASTGTIQRADAEVLSIDTYDRSIALNGVANGYRNKVDTLIDWITLAPGPNEIYIYPPTPAPVTPNSGELTIYYRSGWIG